MTTTVRVITHDWPVRVLSYPCANGQPVDGAEWTVIREVDPNQQHDFHVHSGMDLCIQELPLPVAAPPPPASPLAEV